MSAIGQNNTVAVPILKVSSLSPVKAWAFFGSLILFLQIYAFGQWMTSDQFAPSPVGDTPLPDGMSFWLVFWQATMAILFLIMLAITLRSCIREGRMTTNAIIMVAAISCYWQDGLAGYFRVFIVYNSHMLNMGSWYPFIPGWIFPNAQGISEPIVFGPGAYAGCWALFVLGGGWILRQCQNRWPGLTMVQIIAIALVVGVIFDFMIEFTWVQQGLYRFPYAIQSLSIFPGEPNQYPLYESLFGLTMGTTVALFYFRDDKGLTWVEKGADKISTVAGKYLVRSLAMIGFFNILFFMTYTGPVWFLSFQSDAFLADTPSYILNGMCGEGTQYECPAPDVHMVLPESGPLPPYTGRN